MKALRFYAPGDVRLEDVPEPTCGPREVKIKVKNCSTCGTDVKIRNNGHVNITRVTTMGHEVAGEVVEVGAEARGGFQVGDRVQCIAAVPCGDCYECGKGWMEVCQNQTSVGYQYDGGFAEYMIVPEQVLKVDGLNRIPDNVGYDEASAAEPFACAINAQEQLGIEEGDFTVVFGAGPIGCMPSGTSGPTRTVTSAPSTAISGVIGRLPTAGRSTRWCSSSTGSGAIPTRAATWSPPGTRATSNGWRCRPAMRSFSSTSLRRRLATPTSDPGCRVSCTSAAPTSFSVYPSTSPPTPS